MRFDDEAQGRVIALKGHAFRVMLRLNIDNDISSCCSCRRISASLGLSNLEAVAVCGGGTESRTSWVVSMGAELGLALTSTAFSCMALVRRSA